MKTKSRKVVLTVSLLLVGALCAPALFADPREQPGSTNAAQPLGTGGLTLPSATPQLPGAAPLPGTFQIPGTTPLPGTSQVPGVTSGSQGAGVPTGIPGQRGLTRQATPPPVYSLPAIPTGGAPATVQPGAVMVPNGYPPPSAGPAYAPPGGYMPVPPTAYRSLGSGIAGANPMLPPTGPVGSGTMPSYGVTSSTAGHLVPAIGTTPGVIPGALAERPFSDYTPPPIYSPYMELFRTDNNQGRLSNYYYFYKPEVGQQVFNRQTQGSLNSLQSTTRVQGSQLQQVEQRVQPPTQTAPGFMNFQQYYPGLKQ